MGVYDDVIEDSYVDFDVNIVSVFFFPVFHYIFLK